MPQFFKADTTTTLGALRTRLTFRIVFPETTREEVTRDKFVKRVLLGLWKFRPEDILCLLSLEKLGVYEISFKEAAEFGRAAVVIEDMSGHPLLEDVRYEAAAIRHNIYVQMFNPYVRERDISLYLRRYVRLLGAGQKVVDQHGLWTGRWRYVAEVDTDNLPSRVFALGPDRGRLYIPDLPESDACWSCGEHGHVSKNCSVKKCVQCNEVGHFAMDCTRPKRCVLCMSDKHLFRLCPKRGKSYARVVASLADGADRTGSPPVREPPKPQKPVDSQSGEVVSDAGAFGANASHARPHGSQDGDLAGNAPGAASMTEESRPPQGGGGGGDCALPSPPCSWAESVEALSDLEEQESEGSMVTVGEDGQNAARKKRRRQGGEGNGGPGRRPRRQSGSESPGSTPPAGSEEGAVYSTAGESESETEELVSRELPPSQPGIAGWDERGLMVATGMAPAPGAEPPPGTA